MKKRLICRKNRDHSREESLLEIFRRNRDLVPPCFGSGIKDDVCKLYCYFGSLSEELLSEISVRSKIMIELIKGGVLENLRLKDDPARLTLDCLFRFQYTHPGYPNLPHRKLSAINVARRKAKIERWEFILELQKFEERRRKKE